MKSLTEVNLKEPQIRNHFPIWCHHHGWKMKVVEFNKKEKRVSIAGSAAKLVIETGGENSDVWNVRWEIFQSSGKDLGCREFKTCELAAAFGLTEDSGDYGQWVIDQFGAHSAEQGKYIRWKHFLNIPCPGSGHDGDPNVSIHIDDEMRSTVELLLK